MAELVRQYAPGLTIAFACCVINGFPNIYSGRILGCYCGLIEFNIPSDHQFEFWYKFPHSKFENLDNVNVEGFSDTKMLSKPHSP